MGAIADLTVVSVRFLAVLAACALGLWVLAALQLRRCLHRRVRARSVCSAAAAAVLLSLVFSADCVNSYYSYLPNVSDVTDAITQVPPPQLAAVELASEEHRQIPTEGRLVTLSIPAGVSGLGRTTAWVWLPPQYFSEPSRRLSVVYLFHGSPGVPKDWFHAEQAQRIGTGLARDGLPVIEVAPQMSRGWLDDSECVDGVRERIETHLLQDVIPTVDRNLRTIADRNHRIFAGMSAGGYCSLNLGLRNQAVAATILDFSGDTGPTHSGGMRALFGSHAATAAPANNPAGYAVHLRRSAPTRVWLDCGLADNGPLKQLKAIAPVLRDDGFTVVLQNRPGGHTYSTWRPALRQSLDWALKANS